MSNKPREQQDVGDDDNKRYFVLTTGRSGSSLLGRILADAGADFAGGESESWSLLASAFESGETDKTAYLFSQAHHFRMNFAHSLLFSLYHKKIATFKRYAARRRLEKQLAKTSFFKETANLHFTVRPAADLGYQPVIILNYRSYPDWMGSLYPGSKYETVESLTGTYLAILRNALALLGLFGGCVVNYEDLMDPESTRWAGPLGAVTGFDSQALLDSRRRRLKSPGTNSSLPVRSREAEELEALLRGFEGQAVAPSEAALKRWLKPAAAS